MEVYCRMKVNDSDTGKLLGKSDTILYVEDCDSLDEVGEKYEEDISEYLKDLLHPDIFLCNCVARVDMVELADEYEEVNL